MNPFLPIPRSFLATVLVLAGTHANAADLYWDADGDTTAGTGGTGAWNTSSSFWRDGSATGPAGAWINGSAAFLGGTYGTLTVPVNTAIQVSQINVVAGTTGTAPFAIGTANVTTGTLAFTGPAKSVNVPAGLLLTISSPVAQVSATGESPQLVVQGGGTLTLSRANRAYAGTLLSSGAGTTVVFSATNGLDSGSATTALTVRDGGTIAVNATNNFRTSVTLGGSGFAGGTLKLGHIAALAGQGSMSFTSSGTSKSTILSTLTNTGTDFGAINANTTTRNFTVNATGDPSGVDLEFSAGWRNATLNKLGAGVFRLNSGFTINRANDYTTFLYTNETIRVGAGTLLNEGQVKCMTNVNSNGTAKTGATTGTFDAVTVNGTGVFELSRATGSFTSGLAFGPGQNSLTLNNGGTLRYAGVNPDLSASLNTLNGSGGTVDTNTQNVTFATALTGPGGLTKAGAGTLTLAAPATYAGTTTVSGGTLVIGAASSLASTVLDVRDTAVLDLSAVGGIVLNTPGSIVTGTGTGSITGNLALGAGTEIRPGGLALMGTTAITGTFNLAGDYRADLGNATSDKITASAAADLSGATITPVSTAPFLPGTYTLLDYVTLAGTPALVLDPQVAASRYNPVLNLGPKTSPGSITLTLSPLAVLDWAGTPAAGWENNAAGWKNGAVADVFKTLDYVTFGDLTAPNDNYGVSVPGEVHTTGITFTHTAPNTYTLGGTGFITGPGGLDLTGGGTVIVDTDLAYTGTTSLASGTLFLNSAHNGGGTYTVAAGGTLAGNGSTGSSVALSGTLSPGAAAGTLDAIGTGPLVLNEGATLALEINTGTVGSDTVLVTGNVTRPGTIVNLALTDLGGNVPLVAGTKLTLVDYSGTWNAANVLHYGGNPVPNNSVIALGVNTFLVNYADAGAMTLTVATPYEAWIAAYLTQVPAAADRLPAADPDGDGSSNFDEFALKGNPADGSDNGLLAVVIQDTDSPADTAELTLVAAVRRGAGFTATANNAQQALAGGVSYTVEGSQSLTTWTTPVSALPAGSDTPPAGSGLTENLTGTDWEYRTFSLDASEGLPGKGFLRVQISQ